jgi:hypothetical protein
MMEQDEAHLRVLPLDDDHYTQQEIKDISEGVVHAYAMHQPKNAYNEKMLRKTVTEDNPLAVIKCKDETSSNNNTSTSKAMVELSKTNIEPKCDLYNGKLALPLK